MAGPFHEYMMKKMAGDNPEMDDEDEGDSPYSTLVRQGAPDPVVNQPETVGRAPGSTPKQTGMDQRPKSLDILEQGQNDVADIRRAGMHANSQANIIGALSQAAAGGSKAGDTPALYGNLVNQNQGIVQGAISDSAQRLAVQKAIEANQTKLAGANIAAGAKENVANIGAGAGIQKANIGAEGRNAQTEAYKERTGTMGQVAGARQGNQDIRTGNMAFKDSDITQSRTKMAASSALNNLIEGIKNHEITDSKNVRNQLTNMLTTIEQNGGGTGHDRANMGIDSLYGRIQDLGSFVESKPLSSIPPEYLDQIQTEGNALGTRAAQNFKNATDAKLSGADLSGGDPSKDPGRTHQLMKQNQQQFLKSTGFDPETAQPMSRGSSGGMIKIRDPQGNIRTIPLAKKAAALAAGGTLAQ